MPETREPGSTPTCRSCGRPPASGRRIPLGWYSLTVNVPDYLDHRGRGYVYLGVFCSPECLAAHMPEVDRQAQLTSGLYERD
jgi:hypothetical protein